MKYFLLSLCFSFLFGKELPQYIDGVAAVVEEHIILKSDLAQMVNMAAVQSGIDPSKDQSSFLRLQNSVLQSMVDQKILLEMADIDSITVEEKEVDQSLEQQVQMLVAQAGGEKRAEEILGQSLSDFRREFWFDMRDRLVSEKYQQQLLNSINITRGGVVDFYKSYKEKYRSVLDELPLTESEKNAIITEANYAFRLNMYMFDELKGNAAKSFFQIVFRAIFDRIPR